MDVVVSRFAEIGGRLSQFTLRSRVASRREFFFPVGIVRDIVHWGGQLAELARRRPPSGLATTSRSVFETNPVS